MDVLNICSSFLIDFTIRFDQSPYSVSEDDGSAQVGLVLSVPLSTIITVQVLNTDGTATGEYCSILINY